MKTYIDFEHTIQFEEFFIPKDPANSFYQQFLEEQVNGKAMLVPFVPPAPTWKDIRYNRNQILKESDWVVLSDTNIPNKQEWLVYRQTLRDITTLYSETSSIVWPQAPSLSAEQPLESKILFAAERYISGYFTNMQLLQMKNWWDTIPHDYTPKLSAAYIWTDDVSKTALSGGNIFPLPPFVFTDIAVEINSLLFPQL